jgi:uncharacterized damage-inducible protein DinB
MGNDQELRQQLARLLDWEEAHVGFGAAVAGLPDALRGRQPSGLPYSPWQLLEHIRLAQRDILEFCQDPGYRPRRWPEDYWPAAASPPRPEAWDASVAEIHRDREALKALATDDALDLLAAIPHGSGQTYLRELLLVADHTAYHVGQIVVVRRLLGSWNAG